MDEENKLICSVCGLSSNQIGPCPACGSEIRNPNRDTMVTESDKSIVLNYGISFSPKIVRSENIPFGLNFAPDV